MNKNTLGKFALLAASFCVLALGACKKEEEAAQPAIRPVKVITISDKQDLATRKFPGRAKASKEATLAFEVSGQLNKFPANIGDVVSKGDVLVQLDLRDFESALTSAKAETTRAKAQYERVKKAASMNAVSRQDLSDALAAYESAKARVEIRQKALENATIRAPYDAIVVETFFENFEAVQPKQPVVRIVDPSQIEMVVDIPEDLIGSVKTGASVTASFDAVPDVELNAKVTEIGAEASQTTRTYPVTIIMNQPKGGIKILPGMAGSAWSKKNNDKHGGGMEGFNVPMTSISTDDDEKGSFVWVVDPKTGIVSKRAVKTGNVTKQGVLIVDGLSVGDVVVTAGTNKIQEGRQVRIIK